MDTTGYTRTRPNPPPRPSMVDEVRASRARLLLLRWVCGGGNTASDAYLAETWELEPRSVRRARTWMVGHGLAHAERRSRGIAYQTTTAGVELLQEVEASISRSRSGGSLRLAMRRIMRHCAEFKDSVRDVAGVFGVQVSDTLREAVAYAVAYDGIGSSDYADAAYNLGRKARGFAERGEAFGTITAEQWLYRMAKKWRWIPTEGEASQIRTRRSKLKRETFRPEQPVERPPSSVTGLEEPSVSRRKVAAAAAVCGKDNWAWLRMMRVQRMSSTGVVLNTSHWFGLSSQAEVQAFKDARVAFRAEWARKQPDCQVWFDDTPLDNHGMTLGEIARLA